MRYLKADLVKLPNRAPLFVAKGHCQACNQELTGRQRLYCSAVCTDWFYRYWCSRPAYVRATFIRDDWACQACGYHQMREDKPWLPDMSNLERDHIIPLARGGTTTMENLQTLCRSCNRAKGIKILGETKNDSPTGIPVPPPFRMPSGVPLCGEAWLGAHLEDHTVEEIEALTIGISCGNRRLAPVSLASKKGTVKKLLGGVDYEDRQLPNCV